jgi:diacylglycerol kinase family enzyme
LDPGDPAGGLRAFGDGVEGRIDLGNVNGRPFLNLVSLGVYGEAVKRSGYRDAKARTLLETVHAVLGPGGAAPEMSLMDDLGAEHNHPVIVLVSNNPYALERPMARGARPALDGGRLGVIVIDAPSGSRRRPERAWSARSLEVRAPSTLNAGVDGEATELTPPLRFSIRPRALRVRVPTRETARWRPPRPTTAQRRSQRP